jgi:hypothetical protein
MRVQSTGRTVCVAMLSAACGLMVCLTAGCTAASASFASRSSPVAVRTSRSSPVAVRTVPSRFCAYEIRTPTAAEIAAINRYWTPLARSAVRLVSRGKMLVEAPKRHLSPAQRQALRRAEWAWRAFAPRPMLVCLRVPAGQGDPRARAPVRSPVSEPGKPMSVRPLHLGRGLSEPLVGGGEQGEQVRAADQHLRRLERSQQQVGSGRRGGWQGAQPARAHAR